MNATQNLIEFYQAQIETLRSKVDELRTENGKLKMELLKNQLR